MLNSANNYLSYYLHECYTVTLIFGFDSLMLYFCYFFDYLLLFVYLFIITYYYLSIFSSCYRSIFYSYVHVNIISRKLSKNDFMIQNVVLSYMNNVYNHNTINSSNYLSFELIFT